MLGWLPALEVSYFGQKSALSATQTTYRSAIDSLYSNLGSVYGLCDSLDDKSRNLLLQPTTIQSYNRYRTAAVAGDLATAADFPGTAGWFRPACLGPHLTAAKAVPTAIGPAGRPASID